MTNVRDTADKQIFPHRLLLLALITEESNMSVIALMSQSLFFDKCIKNKISVILYLSETKTKIVLFYMCLSVLSDFSVCGLKS